MVGSATGVDTTSATSAGMTDSTYIHDREPSLGHVDREGEHPTASDAWFSVERSCEN